MALAADLAARLAGAAGIWAAVTLLLWTADGRLPREARTAFDRYLRSGQPSTPQQAETLGAAMLAASIGQQRIGGLLAHLLRSAVGCLLVAAILWVMATPRLPAGFVSDADALARFAGRLVLSGLVTVLLVDWAAAAVTGPLSPRIARASAGGVLGYMALDLATRLAALAVVTAATFALYAQTAGSFGGSWRTGLAVVPETLLAALRLEGLSGIYVWAALLGGFPLALVLLARLATHPSAAPVGRALVRLPALPDHPARALGLLLGALAGAAGLILSLALGALRSSGF